MTFDEIVDDLASRLGLESDEALERLGRAVNRHNRRISASLNLTPLRRGSVSEATTADDADLEFSGVEKILNIWHSIGGSRSDLTEVTPAKLRSFGEPVSGIPTVYAITAMTSNSVTVTFDALPDDEYDVFADAITILPDLSGADNPAIPQSYQDAIAEAVLADEYIKQEKKALSDRAERVSEKLIGELRHFIAKSSTLSLRQGDISTPSARGGGGGGGSSETSLANANYTQTGLITFNRGTSAPFAVANVAAAAIANLDADKLDGEQGADYHNASNLDAGTLPDARFPATLPAASGVNLTALNATNLASGTVPAARFPTWTSPAFNAAIFTASGSMTWTVGSGDVSAFAYILFGKTMIVQFSLNTTTVGGTPSDQLLIGIPGGYVASRDALQPVFLVDGAARTTGYAQVTPAGTTIKIYRTDAGNFSAATNTTFVLGQITFEVQ